MARLYKSIVFLVCGLLLVGNVWADPLAARIRFVPAGTIEATNVQDAIEEAATEGGAGTPGGDDTHVQYNDGDAFAGEATFTYNKTLNTLSIDRIVIGPGVADYVLPTARGAANTYLRDNGGGAVTFSALSGIGPANFTPSTDFGDVNTDAGGALRYGGDSIDPAAINWGAYDYLDEEGAVDIAAYPAVGTFESGDTFLVLEAGVGIREADYDDLPGGGATAWDNIGNPDNSGTTTITFDNGENTIFTSNADGGTSHFILRNTDTDLASATIILNLGYYDTASANGEFLRCSDNFGDVPNTLFSVGLGGLITTATGLDAIGAVDMDYGSVDVTDHTFVTDGTGTAEIVLPAGSIDGTEILDDTVDSGDYATDSIDNEHINWADIDNLGDEGAVTLASTVTNATLTTALTVDTGTVGLIGNVANTSVLTLGAGASSISGTNTGDNSGTDDQTIDVFSIDAVSYTHLTLPTKRIV